MNPVFSLLNESILTICLVLSLLLSVSLNKNRKKSAAVLFSQQVFYNQMTSIVPIFNLSVVCFNFLFILWKFYTMYFNHNCLLPQLLLDLCPFLTYQILCALLFFSNPLSPKALHIYYLHTAFHWSTVNLPVDLQLSVANSSLARVRMMCCFPAFPCWHLV